RRLCRGPVSRHTAVPVAPARRVPAWCDGPAGHVARLGVAVGPRLRDARRREGPGPADAAAPRPAPSRGGAGGRDGRRRAGGHPRPRPRSALMALTGRLGLLALLGAIVPLFVPSWWSLFAVWGALLMGVVIDFALAGNVRALRFHRS